MPQMPVSLEGAKAYLVKLYDCFKGDSRLTLNLCLKGTNGMVLASDSRGTFGDPRGVTAQNDNMKKLYAVSKYVGVVIAGSGELGATIMDEIPNLIRTSNIEGVTPVMNEVRKILMERFDQWFKGYSIVQVLGSTSPVRPTLVIVIGGYEIDAEGRPTVQKIYSLNCHNNFAPMLHDYGYALNGVAQYALYLLNRLYTLDLTVEKLLPLGAYTITETASQDGKVGGPVQLMKIMPDTGCAILKTEEINSILLDNNLRSEKLKLLFYGDESHATG
jgi:20S proteasome alpha/beta subunit